MFILYIVSVTWLVERNTYPKDVDIEVEEVYHMLHFLYIRPIFQFHRPIYTEDVVGIWLVDFHIPHVNQLFFQTNQKVLHFCIFNNCVQNPLALFLEFF